VILRLVSYNIRYGGTGREQALAACIRSAAPDLVVLQEATNTAVIEAVAKASGLPHWGARPGYSLGYMSRVPVQASWHRPRVSRHAFLELLPAGTSWHVFGVHLSAVHAAGTERRRVYELRALLAAIGREQPGPHALVGDFNTLAPGELLDVAKLPARLRALVWLSGGRIRWRTIQTVLDAGYVDAFRRLHPDVVGNTFPTWDPHVRLDYLFVPGGFVACVRGCEVLSPPEVAAASDHFPLFTELEV
jgi:endonuclease/exonuclease/phosphatase family metal-dependent hydrolase